MRFKTFLCSVSAILFTIFVMPSHAFADEKNAAWSEIMHMNQAETYRGDPRSDPKYIENLVDYMFVQNEKSSFFLEIHEPQRKIQVALPRTEIQLDANALQNKTYSEIRLIYKDKATAGAVLQKLAATESKPSPYQNYTYYRDQNGYIFPTFFSEKTAPVITQVARTLYAQAQKEFLRNAKATEKAFTNLLFWYMGARFPIKASAPAIEASSSIPSLLNQLKGIEQTIAQEVMGMLSSGELAALRGAHQAGKPLIVHVGGRLIQYEPALPASGMTLFGENGFVLGKEAFRSQEELTKTLLHEVYRLQTSAVRTTGASGELVAKETQAAFQFAEKTYPVIKAAVK